MACPLEKKLVSMSPSAHFLKVNPLLFETFEKQMLKIEITRFKDIFIEKYVSYFCGIFYFSYSKLNSRVLPTLTYMYLTGSS